MLLWLYPCCSLCLDCPCPPTSPMSVTRFLVLQGLAQISLSLKLPSTNPKQNKLFLPVHPTASLFACYFCSTTCCLSLHSASPVPTVQPAWHAICTLACFSDSHCRCPNSHRNLHPNIICLLK